MLVQFGVFLVIQSIQLMSPKDKTNPIESKKESHDRNIWSIKTWCQGNFLWIWSLFLCFEQYLIQVSYTSLFSTYPYQFKAIYKILGIICEEIINVKLSNRLMLLTFSTVIGLVENLTTVGAPNLIVFIISYFIDNCL